MLMTEENYIMNLAARHGLTKWKMAQRELIIRSLIRNNGNRTYVADDLGISVRTVRNKFKELAIPRDTGIKK